MLEEWHKRGQPKGFILVFTYRDLKQMISPEITAQKFLKQAASAQVAHSQCRSRLYPHEKLYMGTHVFVYVKPEMQEYIYNYFRMLQAELAFMQANPTEEDQPSG